MPPRPRYSKGCYACRRMKVKCDEQMPQCRRCTKGGRKCPGFPEITNFLSMNSDFPNQAPQPTPLRHPTCNASHPPLERQLNIQPSTDWVQYSLSYFFKNFVHPPRADGLGYLQFLPGLLSTQSNYVCLQNSLRAVAMASLANISSTQSLHFKADQLYCTALRSTSTSLQCYSGQDDAALLASIFLLQKREALSANMQATDPHERGLVNLLQVGAPRKPRSPPEVGLLWTIRARLQLRSMDGRTGCSDGLNALDLPTGAQRTPLEPDLVLSYENVSKFRQELRRIVKLRHDGLFEQSTSELELRKALDLAFKTERELLTWPLSLQKEHLPGKIEIAGAGEIGLGLKFATKAYIFVDLQDGCRWSVYWSSRIQLLCTIQEGLELVSQMGMQYSPSLSREVIKLSIQSAADSICSAIPFMIGEIDSEGNPSIGQRGQALGAYFATRFLHIVNEVPFLPGQQRLWILDCLLKFGQVWGIGAALRARELGIQRLRLDDDMTL